MSKCRERGLDMAVVLLPSTEPATSLTILLLVLGRHIISAGAVGAQEKLFVVRAVLKGLPSLW